MQDVYTVRGRELWVTVDGSDHHVVPNDGRTLPPVQVTLTYPPAAAMLHLYGNPLPEWAAAWAASEAKPEAYANAGGEEERDGVTSAAFEELMEKLAELVLSKR